MKNRVYGVLGIASIMANWNADFTGYPKTISTGETFGSDKAFKYPIKKMWVEQGKKVLYIKSLTFSDKKGEISLVPRTLKERYEQIFNVPDLKKCKDMKTVLTNLFKADDVRNFGATFAEEGNNISITGAVQIGQGFNKYDDTNAEEQQILSPFKDGSKEGKKDSNKDSTENEKDDKEAKNSTLGTKIVSNEAHYFYPFSINPRAYDDFVELGVTDGYTEDDYNEFKEAAITAATSYATNAKVGCENEFALFVETEPTLYLPNLSEYVEFEKGETTNVIRIKCSSLLNEVSDRIKSVEIYYNPLTTELEQDIKGAKVFNIFTQKEV